MDKYVSTVALIINGQEITDFKSVEEKARTPRKQVNLVKKTGVMNATQRYGVGLDYVVPADRPEFDFEGLEDATLVIDYENGSRVTYTGVATLDIGATKFDGDNETIRTIDLVAGKRIQE